ncbi:MAG: hypothetical protein HC902_09190 [Calothrix sp. SM1_5_4]|nr:hypothetical protein [Calothrix sp. SM1_5_4]
MNHELLHRKIIENCDKVQHWFREKSHGLHFPFYSSFDLRDAGFKIGPVDANIFPAGFNNICLTDRESAVEITRSYLDDHYPSGTRRILLLTEEHTQNPYYWDNVLTLKTILEGAGREVRVAIPKTLSSPLQVQSASGGALTVYTAARRGGGVDIDGFVPDLIICNNDFSVENEEWARELETPMNPPRELGWYRRRKDRFFRVYNEFAGEFCGLLEVDPWTMQVETEVFSHFEVDSEDSRDQLAAAAQGLYGRVRAKYREHGIEREPFSVRQEQRGHLWTWRYSGQTPGRDPLLEL